MSTTAIANTLTSSGGTNTQPSMQTIDKGVLSLAKEAMFCNEDKKFNPKVYAYGELITDFSALFRSIDGLTTASTAITPMAHASGANVVLGPIYTYNGYEEKKDGDKVGNNKARRNGILTMMKGLSLTVFGAAALAFRSISLGMPNNVKAVSLSGDIFSGVGLAFFTIGFIRLLARVGDIFILKMKMMAATFKGKNGDAFEFALISKKLIAEPKVKTIEKEEAKFNRLKPEEKAAFKKELKTWITAVLTTNVDADVRGKLEKWSDLAEGTDEELKALYVAVRIGTRKQQKLLAHFGGDAKTLAEVTEKAKEVIENLDEKAKNLNVGFESFHDLLKHSRKSTDSAKHKAAVEFLGKAENFEDVSATIKEVAKTTHSALNTSMLKYALGSAVYGLGIVLWILGYFFVAGVGATVITAAWGVIAVASIYLDGKDLWDNRNHEMVDRKERIAMIALSVFALAVAVLSLVVTIGTGGLAPILFAAVLTVAYMGLAIYAHYKREKAVYMKLNTTDDLMKEKAV